MNEPDNKHSKHSSRGNHGDTVVAVDQGKSGTRAEARVRSGASVHSAAAGLSFSRGSELGTTGAEAVVDAVAGLRLPAPPDVVSIGTTAAPGTQEERSALAAELRARLGATRVLLTEDAVTAHLGAFRGAPGVVVSAGTGSIALWSDSQTCARVDGWGPVLGDHGSGFAIGQAGLRAAFAAVDGRASVTSLAEPARSHLGGLDLDAAWKLYAEANPTDFVAEFAVAVLREAQAGDQVARAVVDQAAQDLATSAALAAKRPLAAGEQPQCCAVGRLMRAPVLRNAFAARATQLGLVVVPALTGSLAGAMLLAAQGPPPAFASLVGLAGEQ